MPDIWDAIGPAPFNGEKKQQAEDLVARLRTMHSMLVSEDRLPSPGEIQHSECIIAKLIDDFDADPRGMEEIRNAIRGEASSSNSPSNMSDITAEVTESDSERAAQLMMNMKRSGISVKHVALSSGSGSGSLEECIAAAKADAVQNGEAEPTVLVMGGEESIEDQLAKVKEDAFVHSAIDAALDVLRLEDNFADFKEETTRKDVEAAARGLYRSTMQQKGRGPTLEEAGEKATQLAAKAAKRMNDKRLDVVNAVNAVNEFIDNKPEGYDESRTEMTAMNMMELHAMFKKLLSGEETDFTDAFLMQLEGAEAGMKSSAFGQSMTETWKMIDDTHPRSFFPDDRSGTIQWHRERWSKIKEAMTNSNTANGKKEVDAVNNRLAAQMKSDLKPATEASGKCSKQQRKFMAKTFKKALDAFPPVKEYRKPDGELWPDMLSYVTEKDKELVGVNDKLLFRRVLENMPKDHPARPELVAQLVKTRKKEQIKNAPWLGINGIEPGSENSMSVRMIMDNGESITLCLPMDRYTIYNGIEPVGKLVTWDEAYNGGVLKDGDNICSCGTANG